MSRIHKKSRITENNFKISSFTHHLRSTHSNSSNRTYIITHIKTQGEQSPQTYLILHIIGCLDVLVIKFQWRKWANLVVSLGLVIVLPAEGLRWDAQADGDDAVNLAHLGGQHL